MTSITIQNIDEFLEWRLRMLASQHGRSMEDEARDILSTALAAKPSGQGEPSVDAIRARFEPFGWVELDIPPREPMR